MKKVLPILLAISIIATCFVACSSKKGDDTTTTAAGETTVVTTDDAKVTEADAINLIESYTDKELGITKEDRAACSFMVASNGEFIEDQDAYYVKVIAAIKNAHEDPETKEITYTFDCKGEYYIRYDGKQILSKDMESGELSEMKVKPVPTTTAPAIPEGHQDKE